MTTQHPSLVVKDWGSVPAGGAGYAFIKSASVSTGITRAKVTYRLSGEACGSAGEASPCNTATVFVFACSTADAAAVTDASVVATWLATADDLTWTPTTSPPYNFVKSVSLKNRVVGHQNATVQGDAGDEIESHTCLETGQQKFGVSCLDTMLPTAADRQKLIIVFVAAEPVSTATTPTFVSGSAEITVI